MINRQQPSRWDSHHILLQGVLSMWRAVCNKISILKAKLQFLLALLPSARGSDRTHWSFGYKTQSQTRQWAPAWDEYKQPNPTWDPVGEQELGSGLGWKSLEVATWQLYVLPHQAPEGSCCHFPPVPWCWRAINALWAFTLYQFFFGSRPGSVNSSRSIQDSPSYPVTAQSQNQTHQFLMAEHLSVSVTIILGKPHNND